MIGLLNQDGAPLVAVLDKSTVVIAMQRPGYSVPSVCMARLATGMAIKPVA